MTRSMARPTTTTSRPPARAASATARRRATFEAKVVTATRAGEALMISARRLATSVAHDVGRVADEGQHTLVAERAEASLLCLVADVGIIVELPVARVQREAEG